jgi:glycosyltransferase involved in cell wall biosynthesis
MKMFQRVILMTPSMSKGGAETQLVKVALHLQKNFNKVLIISLKPIDEFNGDLKRCNLDVLFLRNWSSHGLSNIKLVYSAIRDFKPTVVIAFMFIAIIFARLYKLMFNFKLISTIRISVIQKKWYIPFRITSSIDDAIVYNSFASKINFENQNLIKKGGVVIHNGISIPVLRHKKDPGIQNDKFSWICVAHFRWNKDYHTLFRAIALIKDRNFKIDIIGELNNEEWPYKIIQDLKIENHVNIMGFRQNIGTYLDKADAFVLSSFSEGMPNAILEAMAHAKPIVVTSIDGNNELVNEAQCGFLCKKQNEHDMAANMIKIMEMTPTEREQYGLNGRKYIETNFKEEIVMGNWMTLINEVAN